MTMQVYVFSKMYCSVILRHDFYSVHFLSMQGLSVSQNRSYLRKILSRIH